MPYVTGYLNIIEAGRPDQGLPGGGFNPVDPGFGRPGQGPVDPGFGNRPGGGVDPGFGNRPPTDPGYGVGSGHHPSHGLPGGGGGSTLPEPPPGIWPPPSPSNPIVPLPPEGSGGGTLPVEPGTIWPPLAPGASGKYLCLVIIPGVGYRYTVIDTTLSPGNEFPTGSPPRPDQGLPPTAQPKK